MIDLSVFYKEQLQLLREEFGITEKILIKMNTDELRRLRAKCFDIECREIDTEGNCSEWGEIAADIVDTLCSEIKRIIKSQKDSAVCEWDTLNIKPREI